jgi:DNA helicase-2/ATP-dependent DNA helicase PcrA
MDWDLAVELAGQLLADRAVNPQWIADINHYLVDEYQDFNRAEQAFVSLLRERATSVVVVGDDDQSLYMSRGGSPEGIRLLHADPSADTVSLVRNRRCRKAIVEAANRFQGRMSAAPRPMLTLKDGGKVLCFSFKSSKAEVAYLADVLAQCIGQIPDDAPAEEGTVCLFPTKRVLNSYYTALSDLVPTARRSALVMEEREWLSHILQLVRRPDQRFVQRFLMNRFAGLKPRHRKLVVDLVLRCDVSPYDAVGSLIDEEKLGGQARQAATAFRVLCDAARSRDSQALALAAASATGIDCRQLSEPIAQFLASLGDASDEDSISAVCDQVLPDSALPLEGPKRVLFLTIHGAKGLTRKYVFLPGLERAWLPGSDTGEKFREKQRLFYVAITRATDAVVITYPHGRAPRDPLNYEMPGRGEGCPFVDEAGHSFAYHP